MTDVVLVLNAGSSSIKFTLFDAEGAGPPLLLRGQVEGLYTSRRDSPPRMPRAPRSVPSHGATARSSGTKAR